MSETTAGPVCPNCGADLSGQDFCASCGQRLAPAKRKSPFKDTLVAVGAVLGLGALGVGCLVGIPVGTCYGVSFAYPPIREHIWAWTYGTLAVIFGVRWVNWRVGRWLGERRYEAQRQAEAMDAEASVER